MQVATEGRSELEDEYRLLPPDIAMVQADNRTAGSPDFSEADTLQGQSNSHLAAAPVPWSPSGRASPSQSWTSETTKRKRQILLVSAIGLSSLLLTGGLFAVFLKWADQSSATVPPSVAQTEPSEPSETAVPSDELPNAAVDSNAEDTNSDREAADDTETKLSDNSIESGVANSTASLTETADEESLSGTSPAIEPTPENVAVDPIAKSTASDQVESQTDSVPALPSRLRELAQLIGEPFEFAVPQTLAVPEKAPVTAEELGIRSASIDKSLPKIDLHAVANERSIRGMRLDDVPLAHAVNYLSLASGLPIIVDANSLIAANADRSAKVRVILDDGTVVACVNQFAEKVALQLQAVDNLFYRLHAQQPDRNLLPLQYSVQDLIADDAERDWLRSAVTKFFPGIAEGITLDDSTLSASPDKVDTYSWFALVRTLENWRRQQAIPSGMPQYRPENLTSPFVMPDEVKGLDQPFDQVMSGPRSVASLLSSLCWRMGLECWVDWPSLRTLGLEPNTLISTITNKRPLRSILKELAFEHNLVSVIIDANTLWLTSSQSYRESPDIFIVPSQNRDLSYWEQFIRPLTPVAKAGVSKTELLMTPDGKFLLVKCCRPTIDFN